MGAAPEIVEHGKTGFLCTDEADLATKLELDASLSRPACRRAVVERFSAARMVADHVRLYRRLVCGCPFAEIGEADRAKVA
jgi:glycosyltransferase involved in cell wall biosynthesis